MIPKTPTTEDQARPLHPSGITDADQAAPKTVPMSARQKELIAWGLRGGKDLVAPTQTQEKTADTASDQADCGIPDDDPASPAPEPETTKADLQQ